MVDAMDVRKGAGAGRPRDPGIDTAVLTAAGRQLDDRGFQALSFESVARTAHTTRAAIYRRWPTRTHLALAVVAWRLDVPPAPDTGCTLCDLAEGMKVFLSAFRTLRPDVLNAIHVACANDEELRAEYRRIVDEPPRAVVTGLLQRAQRRGDLREDVDIGSLLDILNAVIHHRAVVGATHLSNDEAEALIEILMRGAASDYERLVAHSRTIDIQHSLPL